MLWQIKPIDIELAVLCVLVQLPLNGTMAHCPISNVVVSIEYHHHGLAW